MKIIFAGTPEFAATALAALHQEKFDIPLVLTQPDRPAGRGMKLQASAVKKLALSLDIPVSQPLTLLDQIDLLKQHDADLMVVAAYGLLLPESVLNLPRYGCLNIHASLLPRWRGAAPIHRAIEAGDASTGITIMQMDKGLDTGDMVLFESLNIEDTDTTQSLHDKLAALGARLIIQALHELKQTKKLFTYAQPSEGISYAKKILKEEALIDWSLSAEIIERRIRAFIPFPGAYSLFKETPIKFWQAKKISLTLNQQHAMPGQVLSADAKGIVIACGSGALCLTELQKPNAKRLPVYEFLAGFPINAGECFQNLNKAS